MGLFIAKKIPGVSIAAKAYDTYSKGVDLMYEVHGYVMENRFTSTPDDYTHGFTYRNRVTGVSGYQSFGTVAGE
jgi:hypothetical protein